MGTQIALTLNDVDIDVGKNRYWTSHDWLFPPDSIKDINYHYAKGHVEVAPGFETTLKEARFRMDHLGYSIRETEVGFDRAVKRWNRTGSLSLSFDRFRERLTTIDFTTLMPEDLIPFDWDFRNYVIHLLERGADDDWELEDFIFGLDFSITLRVLATRTENLPLPLRWHHHDLVESGWASIEDLTDIDRGTAVANHAKLFAQLQDLSAAEELAGFDRWLVRHGLARGTTYNYRRRDGMVRTDKLTLPVAVRNLLSHPENPHNQSLTDDQLRESLEDMLRVAARPDVVGLLAQV